MAGHMAVHFHALGDAFASVDYRLVPQANPQQQAEDVAAALARLLADAPRLGIDRARVMIIGHSAGAHLAALVGTDPSYLAAHHLPISAIRGVVLLDGAGYDVAAQLRFAGPLLRSLYHRAFGDDPAFQARVSPMLQAAAPNAGRFLIFHIASRADSGAQSVRLGALLNAAGTPAGSNSVDGSHADIFRKLRPTRPPRHRADRRLCRGAVPALIAAPLWSASAHPDVGTEPGEGPYRRTRSFDTSFDDKSVNDSTRG